MRAASVAAIASLLLIAAAGIAVASQRERHQLGSNLVRPVAFVAELPPDESLCQRGMHVPAGTGAVWLRIGTFGRPGPELELELRAAGRREVRGILPAGWQQGDVTVPIPELRAAYRDATVCLRHDGDAPIAIAGGPGTGSGAEIGGAPAAGMIRLEYLEAERRAWFAVVPELIDRLATARDALPGAAALPLAALLMLGVLGGSVALVLREGRR